MWSCLKRKKKTLKYTTITKTLKLTMIFLGMAVALVIRARNDNWLGAVTFR